MIKPTVGRVVWYWPTADDIQCRNLSIKEVGQQPFAATIACVHSDSRVALSVVDHAGKQFGLRDVMLLQDSDDAMPGRAQWMPYQKGQAAKTEALEAKLSEAPAAAPTQRQADPEPMGEAPRVTIEHIHSLIESEHYFTAADGARMSSYGNHPIHNLNTGSLGLLTICVLVLRNGFTILGQAACVSAANFDAEKGRKYARENAIEQIWPLEGYLLRQRLYEQEQDAEQMLVAEVEAGQAAAEALIDHLEAMGSPASVEIPVMRGDRSFKVKVVTE